MWTDKGLAAYDVGSRNCSKIQLFPKTYFWEKALTTKPFDPKTFKEGQRRDWSIAAAGWARWWETFERGLAPVSQRMIQLAHIRPGQRVLDVATGIGEPALTAAGVVGASGRVTATDIAPGMLEIANKRAQDAGGTNIEFFEMDAEALDFSPGVFDAVLCRFGLMFLPNPADSLQRMRRAMKEGGYMAAAVWGPPERAPGISVTMGAVARELQLPPPPPGTPGLFSLGDRRFLEGSMLEAGFEDVETETLDIEMEFDSTDDYIQYLKDVAAPINNLLSGKTKERKDDIWRAVAEANRQFVASDGSLHLKGESVLVTGRR